MVTNKLPQVDFEDSRHQSPPTVCSVCRDTKKFVENNALKQRELWNLT